MVQWVEVFTTKSSDMQKFFSALHMCEHTISQLIHMKMSLGFSVYLSIFEQLVQISPKKLFKIGNYNLLSLMVDFAIVEYE